jgi:phosphoribosylamine---glycine ligase
VGNGGREHALAWKFTQSEVVDQVYCIPGNGGTATLERCQNISLSAEDFDGISRLAQEKQVNVVVVGPEVPLALGITDALSQKGILVFGPSQAGAQIESSKTWAKELMAAAGVPTAKAQSFTDAASAVAYVQVEGAPIVIKADGLAAGKGVTVAETVEEAIAAVSEIFDGKFGSAGSQVLIEECLSGQEVSVLALTDGVTIRPLLPAQDHKRIGEGDTGLNTGGMGVYAPVPLVTNALMHRIQDEVIEPVMAELRSRQIDYRGVLYAGLMITPEGEPKVIEFNCRFGDRYAPRTVGDGLRHSNAKGIWPHCLEARSLCLCRDGRRWIPRSLPEGLSHHRLRGRRHLRNSRFPCWNIVSKWSDFDGRRARPSR